MTTTTATWVAIPALLQYGTQPATIEINNLGKQEKLSLKIVFMGVLAIALFAFAFPWTRVFGG